MENLGVIVEKEWEHIFAIKHCKPNKNIILTYSYFNTVCNCNQVLEMFQTIHYFIYVEVVNSSCFILLRNLHWPGKEIILFFQYQLALGYGFIKKMRTFIASLSFWERFIYGDMFLISWCSYESVFSLCHLLKVLRIVWIYRNLD